MALDARVVNARGGFGTWCWDFVKAEPSKVDDVLRHHSQDVAPSAPIGEGILLATCTDTTETDGAVRRHNHVAKRS